MKISEVAERAELVSGCNLPNLLENVQDELSIASEEAQVIEFKVRLASMIADYQNFLDAF